MANPIESYIADLKSMLVRKMAAERVEAIVKEAETHLRESVQRKISSGVDEATATELAIAAYGVPEKVALAFLRGARQKVLGLRPAWWGCLGALLAICSWDFHWLTLQGYFDNFGRMTQSEIAGCIGLLGAVVLAAAARAGFRSNWFQLIGVTIAAAALSIPLMSIWMIPSTASPQWAFQQGISRLHLNRDLPKVKGTISYLEKYQAIYKQGLRDYAAARSAQDLPQEMANATLLAARLGINSSDQWPRGLAISADGSFVVPREYGVFAEVDGRIWALETVGTFEEAKKKWAELGSNGLGEVTSHLAGFRSIERNASAAMAGRLFFFNPDMYLETVFFTLILLPLFLLIDGIATWTTRPKRRSRARVIAS